MIEVRHLHKTYDRGRRSANKVLHDVSFTLPETGFVCILGASGCGKTSLLNAIGGLDKFDSGTVTAGETSASRYGTAAYEAERNRSFGYIFQNYYLLMDHSVAYNVYMGLHSLDLSHTEKLERVRQALKAVEMEHYLRRTVGELSGGQQQRVAIARALARKPRVIFADEPTGNLDEANTLNICTLLRRISRTSLVVMVTHEERIARFFADRIITLDTGRIAADSRSWDRQTLSASETKTLYAGDYAETELNAEGLNLRLLRQAGAEPVELTVLALQDRIVIKLRDGRSVSCGTAEQHPALLEGKRPTLALETLDSTDADSALLSPESQQSVKAGRGIGFFMLLREAVHLGGGKGMRRAGMRLFLVLLAVLTVFTVSDYITLASLDPETFITSDSRVLELQVEQGSVMYGDGRGFNPVISAYIDYLENSGQDLSLIPHVSITPEYSVTLFRQMEAVSLKFMNFSYVPLSALHEDDLIFGRMPENSEEIVVDRWVLEAAAAKDGIIQNSISDVSYFLDTTLTYSKRNYAPTIVGISDSGQPAVYMDTAGLISIGVGGIAVTPLSDLQARYPGEYDHVELGAGECIVVTNNAGMSYHNRIGQTYTSSTRHSFYIADAIQADVSGNIVLADSEIEQLQWSVVNSHFFLYCGDKNTASAFLAEKDSQPERDGHAIVTVTDRYRDTYLQYQAATTRKADARSIVTATVIVLSMAMLYLLCRAQIRERIGMLAVYRLLGIPGGKLAAIFSMESVLCSLQTALPAVVLSWAYIHVAAKLPELDMKLLLPWQAAALVYTGILCFHAAVSLLPMARLLRLPPARLAAKYDM